MSKKGTKRQHKKQEQRKKYKNMLAWIVGTYGSLKAFREHRRQGLPLPKVNPDYFGAIKLCDI